ncbi:lipase 3 [Drosophila teissieri]|uniref:lipase 3 n=1 Tax=Drosophila teissieri TaxID=7243 RepID=UPI001CBA2385|nr:lipase 3 [Drosophila teissieri]
MLLMKLVFFIDWLLIVCGKPKAKLGFQNFTGRGGDYRVKMMTGVKMIDSHGYPVETHTVRTGDGYILDMFRIPSSHNCKEDGVKPPVLLQHGLISVADCFLVTGPKSGLPFMLADRCYDVWLGNSRGVRYSNRHTKLKASQNAFWHFSWHEMGMEDLPAMIDYILSATQQEALHFVGHSQGCTTLMVLLSMKPEYNRRIKTANLMAPAVFMEHATNKLMKMFGSIILDMKDESFFGPLGIIRFLLRVFCPKSQFKDFCAGLFMLGSEEPSTLMNLTAIPLILATHPASISTRQPKHFLQLRKSGKFRPYDFGVKRNKNLYNQPEPPDYPLENVSPLSPVQIYRSNGDSLVSRKDIHTLISKLDKAVLHNVRLKKWSHTDFIFSNLIEKVINEPIIKVIDLFENKTSRE